MANLEKTLAEIEVLVGEIWLRYSSARDAEACFRVERTLDGIKKDAELVYKKCAETYSSLRKEDYSSASTSFAEMALDSKNLADNLNIFLQTVYGNYSGNLKSLEFATQSAPKCSGEKTIYEIFSGTHNPSNDSIMKLARDSKGHNKGHAILFRTPNQPGFPKDTPYYLTFKDEKTLALRVAYLYEDFFRTQAQAYLEMTRDILQTIADKDQEHFRPKDKNRTFQIQKQRAKNFYQRHANAARMVAGTALLVGGLVGGSLGTLTYQQHQREREMKDTLNKFEYTIDFEERLRCGWDNWEFGAAEDFRKELIKKRKSELQKMLITHPEFSSCYNLKNIFGTSSNLFTQTLDEVEEKQKTLGKYIDNYLAVGGRIQSYWPNPENKAEVFLNKRQEFRCRLQKLIKSTRGQTPNFEQLQELEKLRREVTNLEDTETDLLPYIKPLSINLTNMNPSTR